MQPPSSLRTYWPYAHIHPERNIPSRREQAGEWSARRKHLKLSLRSAIGAGKLPAPGAASPWTTERRTLRFHHSRHHRRQTVASVWQARGRARGPLPRVETITVWSGTIYWMLSGLIGAYFGKNNVDDSFSPACAMAQRLLSCKGPQRVGADRNATTASRPFQRPGQLDCSGEDGGT